jgi:hypothetical protein
MDARSRLGATDQYIPTWSGMGDMTVEVGEIYCVVTNIYGAIICAA